MKISNSTLSVHLIVPRPEGLTPLSLTPSNRVLWWGGCCTRTGPSEGASTTASWKMSSSNTFTPASLPACAQEGR